MATENRTETICKGCQDEHIGTVDHWCKACQEDITRINCNEHLSDEVKKYITDNYSKYLDWLIKQNKKFEWQAEYHTYEETCEDFYISNT